MGNMAGSMRTTKTAVERCQGALHVWSLLVALILILVGCAAPERVREQVPPPEISASTWEQIDRDIAAASASSLAEAERYASDAMDDWRVGIDRRTENDFIPWFTGYWTQQWLTLKLAWYRLNAGDEKDLPAVRLASYLQAQYRDRVLKAVAMKIDPDRVRSEATRRYIGQLARDVKGIPQRRGVPPDRFEERLKGIQAIAVDALPGHNASLYQIVHTDPIALPAFTALDLQLRQGATGLGAGLSDARVSPMTKQAGEKLASRLTIGGGSAAAALLFGGVAGMMISVGAAGYDAMVHENQRPAMEAQLREELAAVTDEMWAGLMENRATGVMAGIYHVHDHINGSIDRMLALTPESDAVPQKVHPSDE